MDFTVLYKVGQAVYFHDDSFDAVSRPDTLCMVVEITSPTKMTLLDIETNTNLYIEVGFNEDMVRSTKKGGV